MRSFSITLTAVLAMVFPALAHADDTVHVPVAMTVVSTNPTPAAHIEASVPYGTTCKVPFGAPVSKVIGDGTNVLVFVDWTDREYTEGECLLGTVFSVTKDEYASMEYRYLLAKRTELVAKVNALATKAREKYQADGFVGDKLRYAVLLDPDSLKERIGLDVLNQSIAEEFVLMATRRKLDMYVAVTSTE